MKKVTALFLSIVLFASATGLFAACGKQTKEPESTDVPDIVQTGGWEKPDSPEITQEVRSLFERLKLVGATYDPIALLGSQIVAGVNYCVLCKTAPVIPEPQETYAIVYLSENLDGTVELTDVQHSTAAAIGSSENMTGAWESAGSPVVTQGAKAALEKACESLVGAEYTPVALLGSQVVAGTNYALLCEINAVVPDAQPSYAIVYVYAGIDGSAEITDTVDFEEVENNIQLPNPIVEYETLEQAQSVVGFTLTVPDSLRIVGYSVIAGETLHVELDGGYLRKAKGAEDISGDYNVYDSTSETEISGKSVTLKGNGGKVMLAIWSENGYTYCAAMQNGVTESEMLSIADAIE